MVSWSAEIDRRVLLDLVIKHNLKPNAEQVSALLGEEVTPKALQHRMAKLRAEYTAMWSKVNAGDFSNTVVATPSTPKKSPKKKKKQVEQDNNDDDDVKSASPSKRKRAQANDKLEVEDSD